MQTELTPTQRQAIERSRAFRASIAARAVPQKPAKERTFAVKGDYVRPPRQTFELAPQALPAEPDPPLRCMHAEPSQPSIVWPAVAGGESIDDEAPSKLIRVEHIMSAICAHFGFTKEMVISRKKTWPVVRARQIGMHLSRRLCHRSFPDIGKRFGGRDHTTAMHADHKIAREILFDAELAHDIALVMDRLDGISS